MHTISAFSIQCLCFFYFSRVSTCPVFVPVQGLYQSRVWPVQGLYLSRVCTVQGLFVQGLSVQGLYWFQISMYKASNKYEGSRDIPFGKWIQDSYTYKHISNLQKSCFTLGQLSSWKLNPLWHVMICSK